MIKRKSRFYVYIVEASDGTYYTGYTNDLDNRLKLHSDGYGSKYLRGRAPLSLVYLREYKYFKNAVHAERNIKKQTRKRKEDLIKNWANAKLSAGAPMLRFSKIHGG